LDLEIYQKSQCAIKARNLKFESWRNIGD